MPTPDNKSVVQGFYDQWNSGAIDFDSLVREDVTNHQPDREPDTGLDKFRQAVSGVMGPFQTRNGRRST
jgi:ketosteroid isomerase-like protein